MKSVRTEKVVITGLALLSSFLVCGLFLVVLGYNPLTVYGIILTGSLGRFYSILKSFTKATPLIFTGLSVYFADQGGLFNIGAEGQLQIGGVTAGILGYELSLVGFPPFLSILVCFVVGFGLAGCWGLVPGWIKARFGANEFIVSMMLNYVASFLCEYLVTYPFRGPGVTAKTNQLPAAYQLPRLVKGSQFNMSFFIGVIAVLLVFLFFRFTSNGYEIRTMGKNKFAAQIAGIDTKKQTMFVFFIAGGLAGLAGVTEVLGIHGFYVNDLSPGYGFDGIAVSVLAQGNPFGVFLSSLLFGALRAGGSRLDLKSKVPSEFITILQAVVIVFIATPKIIQKFGLRREEKNV